jgi:hypothetical protein
MNIKEKIDKEDGKQRKRGDGGKWRRKIDKTTLQFPCHPIPVLFGKPFTEFAPS